MTLAEIRNMALFQAGNDEDELSDFQPALDAYINEGYDSLTYAYARLHLDCENAAGETPYTTLTVVTDAPALPAWMHRAIADYATYMLYRNGNAIKQNRGVPYYQKYLEAHNRAGFDTGATVRRMKNLYAD